MKNEQATRHLNNFLSSYTLPESSQLLNQISDHVTKGIHYAALDKSHKEELLDFLEGLDELLPAVYELHEKRSKPESGER
ncbi:MAG: hypothetical protein Q8S11_01975 [Daejeonella sp.]|uniref:hypothetical protein n=1 Tax=Daejeonella sp. TaxID=2805397 RepID=UPI0027356229|nr:hypothetical protein [Daejeonella sp.]MDP3467071.1 hypothetical protein [Daejeonella sp.]